MKDCKICCDRYKETNDVSYLAKAYNSGSTIPDIAKELGTYPNKIIRLFKKNDIAIKTRSEQVRESFAKGGRKHPTKGRERTEEEKLKISESVGEKWDEISDAERERRRKISRESYENRTDKADFHKKARAGILRAAREGSILEEYLKCEILKELKTVVLHHVEHAIANEKMHLDLFIPEYKAVIEVDGPSHDQPIYGEIRLNRTKLTDDEKNALIVDHGFFMIRIKQKRKSITQRYLRKAWSMLKEVLDSIKNRTATEALIEVVVL